MRLHQTKFLNSQKKKKKNQKVEKTTYRMEKKIANYISDKRLLSNILKKKTSYNSAAHTQKKKIGQQAI